MGKVFALLALLAGPAAAAEPVYESPMRDQCTDELSKDLRWRARLTAELTDDKAYEFQAEQADLFGRHQKFVIAAYAALWILTVAFATALYLRQDGLKQEIARLEAEIKRAAGGKS